MYLAAVAAAAASLAATPAAAQQTPAPAADTVVAVLRSDTFDYVFPVRDSVFRRVFDIDPVDAAGTFRAYASDLEDAYGHRDTVKVTVLGVDSAGAFTGRRRLRVALEAKLPGPGDYRGNFTFVTGNRRTTRFYQVAWGAVSVPPLVIGVPGAVEKQIAWLWGNANIRLTVHDSTRLPVSIYPPVLASLTRAGIGGSDSTVVQGGADDGASACADTTGAVQPNGTLACTLTLQGLTRAGKYTATLRVAGPGIRAATLPVTVYVRRSWLWAAAVIALGALLSELLRQYLRSGRPRLELLRDVKRVLERIDAAAKRPGIAPAEKEVLAALRARLAPIAAEREPEKDAEARPTLAAVRERLELLPGWAALRARVETGGVQDDADAKLNAVRDWLLASESTEEEDRQARADLSAVPAAILKTQKDRMLAAVDRFTEALARERGARAGDAALLALLDREVKARVEAARKEAEAGHLAAADEGLNRARGAYARVLAGDLKARLGPYDRPTWIAPEAWSPTVVEVSEALERVHMAPTPDEAIAAYEAARTAFLRAPALALRDRVRNEIGAAGVPKALREALGSVDEQLGEVLVLVERGQLPEATTALEKAELEYRRVEAEHASPPAASGDMLGDEEEEESGMKAAPAVPQRGATPGGELPPGVPGGTGLLDLFGFSGAVAAARTSAALDAEIARRDRMVSLAMGIAAVVLGLSLLWADAPTWGSFKDVVAAFLWGLGLHKVGTDAFGGIGALAASYAKAPAEGG